MESSNHSVNIHPLADVQSLQVGEGTAVWQFAVILKDAVIGSNCNVNCHTFIENDVQVGNNVTIKAGVFLWDGISIEDNVFIGPNASFTNDRYPRSKEYPEKFQRTIVRKGASIGANATILGGIEIGEKALVGAGAVVTKPVPAYAIVTGNPAVLTGWFDTNGEKLEKKADHWVNISGEKFIVENNQLRKIS